VPGAIVAVQVAPRAPGYALHSHEIYRLEVFLAVMLAIYAVVLVLWLAYQGRSVKVQGPPGGIEGPDPAAGLNEAATAFEEFKKDVAERLDRHDESFEALDERLTAAGA
jgi:hypothetical protein